MRFASLGGSNAANYAAAGKSVTDSAANMFAVQRKTGPDYAGLSKVAMKATADVTKAGFKASEKMTNSAVNAVTGVAVQNHRIAEFKNENEIKNKQKMAGSLAAVGKIAGAGFLAASDPTKGRERPKADFKSVNSDFKTKRDALLQTHRAESDAHGAFSFPEFKPASGGTTPGKVTTGDSPTTGTNTSGTGMTDAWSRWAKVIKSGEGTLGDRGYTTMFTGAQFSDMSKHPALINRSGRLASDAAGAYQFLSTTYNPAAKALGITDFTPASQEKVGKYLAQQRGLAADTVFTDKASFLKELDKIAPEWASMPTLATGTSYYGQGGLSPDEAWRIYNGG